jgi:general secretion pathway protein E
MDGQSSSTTAGTAQALASALRERNLVSEQEMRAALAQVAAQPGERLGTLLVRRGAISEEALLPVQADVFGLPLLDGDQLLGNVSAMRAACRELALPLSWCRAQGVVFWRSGADFSACARDPLRSALREALLAAIGPGARVQWCLARARDIERAHEAVEQGDGRPTVEAPAHLKELAEEAPVIELVNGLFARATDLRASDIHVEPMSDGFEVRMRVDGVLRRVEAYGRDRFDAVVSRIKLLSGLDIAERRLPQDGRLSMRAGGTESDVRVSVIPSVWGESVVMRLLPKERSKDFSLDALGMAPDQRAMFEQWIREPHGIVLVTGPTGSGKSTTLYTALTLANDRRNKIITVEDPVEFRLTGVIQIQVQSDIGYTFAGALRAILRHDPDIVMIGEIRDLETAQIAVQASLTGHMVFSTLHTNDALSAINRLMDMGVEDFLVASSLRGIVAQRLVRNLCNACARPDDSAEHLALIRTMLRDPLQPSEPIRLRAATGCPACGHSGYVGRTGIYEFVPITPALRAAIARARNSGGSLPADGTGEFRTMREDGLRKAWHGITSVDEILRVAGASSEA